ncbi:MAG: Gfo/Idh/MocA family protein [Christensenellales bacterium]|jgi:predicted dehydrogenase
MKKLRVGVVGAGNIACSAHLPAYQALSEVAEVVAIADKNLDRAWEMAAKFGIPQAFDSTEALLAGADVDMIDVCVWNHAHAEVVCASAEAGKAILCEKPLADSLESARRIEAKVKGAGVPFMCAMSARWSPAAQLLKAMIEAGELGNIYYAKTGYIRRRGTPIGWFTDKSKSGGGPVIDIGVHNIDCTWFLMGRPKPTRVSASIYSPIGNFKTRGVSRWQAVDSDVTAFDTEDSATALIHFENGATMFVEVSWAINLPDRRYTEIVGDKAGASLDPFVIYGENAQHYLTDNYPVTFKTNNYEQEIGHFIRCLNTGETPISPLADGLYVQTMLDAIYTSARLGREIEL